MISLLPSDLISLRERRAPSAAYPKSKVRKEKPNATKIVSCKFSAQNALFRRTVKAKRKCNVPA